LNRSKGWDADCHYYHDDLFAPFHSS
jgi:hypothetical protein